MLVTALVWIEDGMMLTCAAPLDTVVETMPPRTPYGPCEVLDPNGEPQPVVWLAEIM